MLLDLRVRGRPQAHGRSARAEVLRAALRAARPSRARGTAVRRGPGGARARARGRFCAEAAGILASIVGRKRTYAWGRSRRWPRGRPSLGVPAAGRAPAAGEHTAEWRRSWTFDRRYRGGHRDQAGAARRAHARRDAAARSWRAPGRSAQAAARQTPATPPTRPTGRSSRSPAAATYGSRTRTAADSAASLRRRTSRSGARRGCRTAGARLHAHGRRAKADPHRRCCRPARRSGSTGATARSTARRCRASGSSPSSRPEAGTPVVYAAQANGVGVTAFDSTPPATPFTDVHDLAWSPDGTKLAYSADRPTPPVRSSSTTARHRLVLTLGRGPSGRPPARDSHSPTRVDLASVAADGTDSARSAKACRSTGGVVPVGTPKFPNLVQRPPSALVVSRGGNGHWLLGFTSMVDNRGPGIVWIRGTRAPGAHVMQVRQLVQLASGGARVDPSSGELHYVVAPPHYHWHLLGFEHYELRSAGDFALRARDHKSGFCIADHWGIAIGVPHGPPRFLEQLRAVRPESDVRRRGLVGRVHRPLSRVLPRPAARHHEAAGRALLARPSRERGLPSARAALLGQRCVAPRPAHVARAARRASRRFGSATRSAAR